jgi:hypothetical protein
VQDIPSLNAEFDIYQETLLRGASFPRSISNVDTIGPSTVGVYTEHLQLPF